MTHLNLRWTMADMDDIERFVRQGWQTSDLAHKYSLSIKEMSKMLARNGIVPQDQWRRWWRV